MESPAVTALRQRLQSVYLSGPGGMNKVGSSGAISVVSPSTLRSPSQLILEASKAAANGVVHENVSVSPPLLPPTSNVGVPTPGALSF